MATNHKVFSDFEVATAEEANNYLMDQTVIKVDTITDLASLPTTVKTAYILNTGILMARDVANDWKPQGGAAAVSETAPTNPQVGQLWVKPSEVLPAPLRHSASAAMVTISATAYANYGSSVAFTADKAMVCQVTYAAWMNGGASTDIRSRLKWSGATTGNSYDQVGGWGGVLATASPNFHTLSISFTLTLPVGVTTFQGEVYKNGTGTASIGYQTVNVAPIAWADEFVAGVS